MRTGGSRCRGSSGGLGAGGEGAAMRANLDYSEATNWCSIASTDQDCSHRTCSLSYGGWLGAVCSLSWRWAGYGLGQETNGSCPPAAKPRCFQYLHGLSQKAFDFALEKYLGFCDWSAPISFLSSGNGKLIFLFFSLFGH